MMKDDILVYISITFVATILILIPQSVTQQKKHELSRMTLFAIVLVVLGIFSGCSKSVPALFIDQPGESWPSFSEDGAWCWFSDPRAIYFEGAHKRTYCGWIDSKGNVMVGYYDHEIRVMESDTVHKNFEIDDHDNPSLFIEDNGTIHLYYTRHSAKDGIYTTHTLDPEDIHEWSPIRQLFLNDTLSGPDFSKTYTYTNIIRLKGEAGKLFLFWRGLDFKPNVSYSEDTGKNWTTGKILILPERVYSNRRPYMKVASDGLQTIHMAFTDGHPRNEPTNSIYYVAYKNGQFYRANGTEIGAWADLPLDPGDCDKVYDASIHGEKAWIWDIASDQSGSPVMVYARFRDSLNHIYYYAAFENGTWNNYELVNSGGWFPHTVEGAIEREPNYSGGIVLDHQDPSRIFLSIAKNGVFEIEQWETENLGKNWKTLPVTVGSTHDNVRPFVVRHYPDPDSPLVLWMNLNKYEHYTDYHANIKINQAGSVR